MKPENLMALNDTYKHLSDVPVSRNLYKTVSNCIRKFIYMQFCIKVVVSNKSFSTNTQLI